MSPRALLPFLLACGLLPGLRAQNLPFSKIASVPVAEAFSSALPVVTGDVDKDGLTDILIGTTEQILLFRGTGTAHVETARPVFTRKRIGSLALADFDGDGILDLAALTPDAVLVMKGGEEGRFGGPAALPLSRAATRGLAAADLNQDGATDIAAAQDSSLALFLNDGQGNFNAGPELATGQHPGSIVVADFNNDGIPDLASGNYPYTDDVSILLGVGAGVFRPLPSLRTGYRPRALAAADFDNDGKLDLAMAHDFGLAVLFGDGSGAFVRGAQVEDSSSPMSIASGDLDGNGTPDIVLGCYYSGRITAVLNNGGGTFRAAGRVLAYGDTFGLALADLNADSQPDIIATSYSGASALIAMGRGQGAFDSPIHLGVLDDSQLRSSSFGVAAILPGRKTVWLLPRGELRGQSVRFDDYPVDARFGDFNGDAVADLAVLTLHASGAKPGEDAGIAIHVLAGRNDGGFEPSARTEAAPAVLPETMTSAPTPAAESGDFNGDGALDVAVADAITNTVRMYAGMGDASFEPGAAVACERPIALTAADFDSDGIQDLAALRMTLERRGAVTVYLGKRAGGLVESNRYELPAWAYGIRTGDFNGDSRPDLAIVTNAEVILLLNAGAGSFRPLPGARFNLPIYPAALMAVADFDRDGKEDVAIVNGYHAREGIAGSLLFLGNADGNLRATGSLGIPLGAVAAASLDWDGDGPPELAVLDGITGALSVFRWGRDSIE